MTTTGATREGLPVGERHVRANPLGALLSLVGIAAFSVAVFLDWLGVEDGSAQGRGRAISGYDLNTIIPFTALLGVGLAVSLLYALAKATRRQHRGLTLVTMAVGLAATGLAVAYLVNPPGVAGAADNATTKSGVFVALAGGALWSLGAGLFAAQPQGDDRHDDAAYPLHSSVGTSRHEVYPADDATRSGTPSAASAEGLG